MGEEEETKPEVAEEKPVEETPEEKSADVKKDAEVKRPEEKPTEAEKKEEVEKEGPGIGSRIKNWVIILLLLVILVLAGTFWLWKTGVEDLKGDNTFLIVVQDKGVAKAGSIYDLSANKAEIINVETLPPVKDRREFLTDAVKQSNRNIDRLIVISVATVTELSTEPSLEYKGKQIPSRDVPGYLTGALHDEVLRGGDPDWMFRAKLLSNWVELYSGKIQDASFGSHVYKVIFSGYRKGSIAVYPRNKALIIIKYIPLEQIIL
ncbi:MAG: hypothetical protein ACE5HH_04650 [Candidatus Hydrothermarchaeales archaeon]